MGVSKIIMLSMLYIILGMYTLAFNRIDNEMFETSMHVAKGVQSEQLARSGSGIANGYMVIRKTFQSFQIQ